MVTTALVAAAIIAGALTIGGLVAGAVVLQMQEQSLYAAKVLSCVAWLLVGVSTCAMLAGAAVIVRTQHLLLNQTQAVDQRLAAIAEHAFVRASAQTGKPDVDHDMVEVRQLLGDIREIMLLPEEQRLARFRNLVQLELKRRLTLANQYIDSREFHRAREELASLANRFGESDDLRKVNERLVSTTRSMLQEDVETATRKVADLMTMARWEQAEQYARELTQKYPEASDPRKLLARVQEERALFDQRHRQRMHDEIQGFVNQRRWREAAGAAEMFIQTFPTGVDTDALREQLETLKANAEIEIRQQLERHIKEYLARKDYWDALELARRIIAEYPASPQAGVLRMQLPRLEDLARQQGTRG
jgi:tetratricopeptide (TPR) repeat protein